MGYGVLAAGYALNNQLTFHILQLSNPGLLSLAKSTTPLLIAVVSSVVFGERLTRLQWQCVVLQVRKRRTNRHSDWHTVPTYTVMLLDFFQGLWHGKPFPRE